MDFTESFGLAVFIHFASRLVSYCIYQSHSMFAVNIQDGILRDVMLVLPFPSQGDIECKWKHCGPTHLDLTLNSFLSCKTQMPNSDLLEHVQPRASRQCGFRNINMVQKLCMEFYVLLPDNGAKCNWLRCLCIVPESLQSARFELLDQ